MIAKNWNLENMPDQTGKTVLVTGANAGLGFLLTRSFAQKNARVIMVCRNQGKAADARDDVLAQFPDAELDIVSLDLANLKSVEQCASTLLDDYESLDIIMCNAGIMAVPYGTTEDGFEMHMGVNYYGHYALVGHLMPLVKKSPGLRIVTTSSLAEKQGKLDLDSPPDEKSYNRWSSYGDSKLAMLMFALILNDKFKSAGIDAKGMSAHPGFAKTDLRTRHMKTEESLFQRFLLWVFEAMSMSGDRGVLPLLCAATDPEINGGEYIGVSGIGEIHGSPKVTKGQKRAYDTDLQEKLWKTSEEKTGVDYEF